MVVVMTNNDEKKVDRKLAMDDQKRCCSAAGIFFGFFDKKVAIDKKVANVTMKRSSKEHWYLSTP